MVWLDLGLNPGLQGHWRTLYLIARLADIHKIISRIWDVDFSFVVLSWGAFEHFLIYQKLFSTIVYFRTYIYVQNANYSLMWLCSASSLCAENSVSFLCFSSHFVTYIFFFSPELAFLIHNIFRFISLILGLHHIKTHISLFHLTLFFINSPHLFLFSKQLQALTLYTYNSSKYYLLSFLLF